MIMIYKKQNPHLFDVPIGEIETNLQSECGWLNSVFGRCERLVKEINGKKFYTANWYVNKNDYVLLQPDDRTLGNFCFFVLDEPTDVEQYYAGDVTRCSIGYSLIVWCDLRTINDSRDTEAVKEQILQALNGTHLHSGRLTVNRVYERAENVFKEFDYDEIDNQFTMHPFAAFRFEGELIVDTLCLPLQ